MIDITPSREFKPKTSAIHHSSGVRVPLHELQMLTQSVATRDYVHAFGTISDSSSEQQKKSPLALLAATCSSIGKTEEKKETREAVTNNTVSVRHSPKITSNDRNVVIKHTTADEKSSFKPYKHLEGKDVSNSAVEKVGFRAPNKDSPTNDNSTQNKSPHFRSKILPHVGTSFHGFQYPYLSDTSGHCYYQGSSSNRFCGGVYYDLPNSSNTHHHPTCFKIDCTGNCTPTMIPTPTSLAPTTLSTRPMFPTPPVSVQSPIKSLGMSSTRPNSLYSRCNCGYCNQTGDMKAGFHQPVPHYHREYLTTVCQDPFCTNCKVPKSSSTASSHGCRTPCFGHHHYDGLTTSLPIPETLPTVPPSMSHLYPYTGFMLRAQNDQNGPFVCNWVQDSKNCGINFKTSEELLQHLRIHTSSANSSSSTSAHTPCNIPGCPCGLKSPLGGGTRLHSTARYHPYLLPNPAFHSPPYHSAMSHYASTHSLPYASSIKPY
ncbi:zinc finger protein 503-like isoform X2 [Xenia sp. Carnegie-2017]|nr:zinc finger protein 503-like isoform X2 [Xenia sp. Carnegie-2017]